MRLPSFCPADYRPVRLTALSQGTYDRATLSPLKNRVGTDCPSNGRPNGRSNDWAAVPEVRFESEDTAAHPLGGAASSNRILPTGSNNSESSLIVLDLPHPSDSPTLRQ
jgi:hypothetical protein